MANTKITALTSATTPLAGTEVLPIVQSSTTKKVSVENLTAGRDVSSSSITTSKAGLSADFYNSTGSGVVEIARFRWNNSGTGGAITLTNQVGTALGQIANGGDSNGTYLSFSSYSNSTALTEWARFGGDGNLQIKVAAKGINFTANSAAAGMTSQLLNWYEEGTWTPTIAANSGAITSYTSSGTYTRIGRQVTLLITFTITNNGTGAGDIRITGLPFTNSSDNLGNGCGRENATSGFMVNAIAVASGTIAVYKYDNTYPGGTNNSIKMSFTYFV